MRNATIAGLLVGVLSLVLAAAPAAAGTISYNTTYGPAGVPDAGTTVSLNQFDEATYGTLTKVTLTLDGTASAGSITWDNESDVATDVTLGIGGQVTAVAPSALTLVVVPLQQGDGVGIVADDDGYPPDFAGADSFTVTGGTGSDSDSAVLTNAALFAPYKGTGTFDIDISSIVKTLVLTSGGTGETKPTAGVTSGVVTVTYEFVPEPATMALLLAGGLGALLRRKSR